MYEFNNDHHLFALFVKENPEYQYLYEENSDARKNGDLNKESHSGEKLWYYMRQEGFLPDSDLTTWLY